MPESLLSNKCSKHKLFTFQERKIFKNVKKGGKSLSQISVKHGYVDGNNKKIFLEATN